MRLLRFLLPLLLWGCGPGEWVPQQGDVILRIRDKAELRQQYMRHGGAELNLQVWGFALSNREPCEIWVTPEAVRMGIIRHELKHCDLGAWHGRL